MTLRRDTASATAAGLRPRAASAGTSSTICTCSSRTPCSETRSTPGLAQQLVANAAGLLTQLARGVAGAREAKG